MGIGWGKYNRPQIGLKPKHFVLFINILFAIFYVALILLLSVEITKGSYLSSLGYVFMILVCVALEDTVTRLPSPFETDTVMVRHSPYSPLVNLKKLQEYEGNLTAGFLAEVAKVPTFVVFLGDMVDGANVLVMFAGAFLLEVFEETNLGIKIFLIASILMLIGSTAFCLQEWYVRGTEEWHIDVPGQIQTYLPPLTNILKNFTRALRVCVSVLRMGCYIMLLVQRSTIITLLSFCFAILEFILGIYDRHCLSTAICIPCPKRSHHFVVPAIRREDGIYVSGCLDCLSNNCSANAVPQVPYQSVGLGAFQVNISPLLPAQQTENTV